MATAIYGRGFAPLENDSCDEEKGRSGVGERDAVGEVVGDGLTGNEVSPDEANQAHSHDADAVDAPAKVGVSYEEERDKALGDVLAKGILPFSAVDVGGLWASVNPECVGLSRFLG